MGTVQAVHKHYKVYTDPKSGVEIGIFKNTKQQGFNDNHWTYGLRGEGFDDTYTSEKAAWNAMQATVRQVHSEIRGKTPDQLETYARKPFQHDIGKAIARAMAKKVKAKAIVMKSLR